MDSINVIYIMFLTYIISDITCVIIGNSLGNYYDILHFIESSRHITAITVMLFYRVILHVFFIIEVSHFIE